MNARQATESRFLDTLRRSELLADEEIDPFVERRGLTESDDTSIAREFLNAQLLTPFQAKYLLHGRWRGLVIGKYRIFEPVSAGGMGEIYLARQAGSDTPVAIKILRSELRESPRMIERFRLEAFAVMTLKHPNLMRGIEYDTIQQMRKQTHYLVTEFVPGPNLYELTVIRRQLPWQQACDIAQQAALGLHYAHQHGFVHRDVKPGNLIVSSSGIVKVVDFGLAQYKGEDESFGFSMRKRRGTERFAAPEQSVSDYPIDPRTDVYSLGCTLFLALCGSPPSDDSPDLYPSSKTAIKRLLARRDDLPADLLPIIKRMLRRKPEQRYETAAEVADALAPFSKQLAVDINYPALLRAREKSRRSEASWNTDAKVTATTEENEPLQTIESHRDAVLNAFSGEADRSTQRRAVGEIGEDGNDRFAEIYRRHRQQVDRLSERIDALEQSLRESRATESELRTLLGAKEIEKQQVIAENRQIVDLMRREAIAIQNAQHEQVTAQQKQRIDQLEQTLQTTLQRLSELQSRYDREIADRDREHAHTVDRLGKQLAGTRELYRSERGKRKRTIKFLRRLQTQIHDLERHRHDVQLQFKQATDSAVSERQQRSRAESMLENCTERLNEVVRRANALSTQVTAMFAQLASHQAEENFFESYEKACESDGDPPHRTHELLDELLADSCPPDTLPNHYSDEE
ncbi:Serine/threonine-protein kinase PknB [Rosistilla carotiformis]|uniref:Serine/threonine-protein kinase PknB n=1 Tax=Rosistilla carotiformis TaxID=2528017 RepID=A0A518JZU6_9BACT|nr:serine/threonine-protein kinase [Rosistilla carotiformis]QDV71068.1 Serine/threonine-protein kinase PknB [Rosistilla carotiformis]